MLIGHSVLHVFRMGVKKSACCLVGVQIASGGGPWNPRTLAVTTSQCAGTTLACVVRGSAKAGAEMQTARILNVSPLTWRYKACALFALQSIYLKTQSADLASPRFANFGGIGVGTQNTKLTKQT
jgi:hypothetical protein